MWSFTLDVCNGFYKPHRFRLTIVSYHSECDSDYLVPKTGLEPAILTAIASKTIVYAIPPLGQNYLQIFLLIAAVAPQWIWRKVTESNRKLLHFNRFPSGATPRVDNLPKMEED